MKMYMFGADKIIRDHDCQRMQGQGLSCQTSMLAPEAMPAYLQKKMLEEILEVMEYTVKDRAKAVDELVDVCEAMMALLHCWGVSFEAFQAMRADKAARRGGYNQGIYMQGVGVPEGHSELPHYLMHPYKYPLKAC